MPSDLADYLAVCQDNVRTTRGRKQLYVVDDGSGKYYSTPYLSHVPFDTDYVVVGSNHVTRLSVRNRDS